MNIEMTIQDSDSSNFPNDTIKLMQQIGDDLGIFYINISTLTLSD